MKKLKIAWDDAFQVSKETYSGPPVTPMSPKLIWVPSGNLTPDQIPSNFPTKKILSEFRQRRIKKIFGDVSGFCYNVETEDYGNFRIFPCGYNLQRFATLYLRDYLNSGDVDVTDHLSEEEIISICYVSHSVIEEEATSEASLLVETKLAEMSEEDILAELGISSFRGRDKESLIDELKSTMEEEESYAIYAQIKANPVYYFLNKEGSFSFSYLLDDSILEYDNIKAAELIISKFANYSYIASFTDSMDSKAYDLGGTWIGTRIT